MGGVVRDWWFRREREDQASSVRDTFTNMNARRLTIFSPQTAYTAEGVSFEQYLARRLGWSVERLVLVFDDFLREIFDRTWCVLVQSAC